jgi:EmrB/QacA subfamily drug resistance transporter
MAAPRTELSLTSTTNFRTITTLIGVALAMFMAALENTVIGTAMPTVIASLGGIEIYSWAFAAYILAATVMTPIWGKMADLIGRRPAIFGGLALFIIGSALSGAAHSMPQLIAFRILQGLGGAALFPIGMTITADILTLEQRTKIIALFSGMWGVASVIGPLVGGYLTAYTQLSWRWCFYIILPFGLLSGVMIYFGYQEQNERRQNISLDYGGTIVLSAALVTLLFLIERGAEFTLLANVAGIFCCLLLFAIFIRIEKRHPEPLMPLDLFRNRVVAMATLHGLFAMMALIGTMSFLPLFVQAVIGTNAAEAGKILVPFIIPWVMTAIIAGRLVLRFGYRPLVLTGMALMLIGASMLTQVSIETTRMKLSFYLIFLGMGGGLTVSILMIAAQQAVARSQLGVTTSMVQFARSIGAALGAAIMGALMGWRLSHLLKGAPAEIAQLASQSEIGSIVRPETRQSLSQSASLFLQKALAGSLRMAFAFVFFTVIIGAIIALFIPGGSVNDLAHPEVQSEESHEMASSFPEA